MAPGKDIQILCTLGPASMSRRVITRLSEAGVDLFRFNLSHIQEKDVGSMIASVRACSDVPICLDTEGAQVRTGQMHGKVLVKEGGVVDICARPLAGTSAAFSLTPVEVVSHLSIGDLISIDFDTALLRVIEKGRNRARAVVLYDGHILSNKGVRIVNKNIPLAPFTKKDVAVIKKGMKAGIRHVALSFANGPEDVLGLRRLCLPDVFIMSKIESHQGLLNLDKILDVSDAILIDRGDLSKEESIVAIPFLQKHVIGRANIKRKPVYVATNLLESMINYRSPTRAEVNDVINTLLDGADGLVLAAETAVGGHPIGSVNTIRSLIQQFKYFSKNKHILSAYKNTPSYLLVPPHGGLLIDREEIIPDDAQHKHKFTRTIKVDEYVMIDAEQIACGAYSPLEGFMTRAQMMSVLEINTLPSKEVWTMPIIWQVPKKEWQSVKKGDRVGLLFENDGEIYAYLDVDDIFTVDLESASQLWFGTNDQQHPGVACFYRKGSFCLGGKITVFKRRRYPLSEYVLTPKEVRTVFEHKGWTKVVAFHTRNVVHRVHEYIQLCALQESYADGLFIHPLIGPKKNNDFTSEAIIKSYEIMMKKFYPKGKVFFSAFPAYPRYAGPREAVFTAICRKNYGATHFIVGRDHSGVGNYYKPTAARDAFYAFKNLGIEIIFFDRVLYCSKCRNYVENCKHDIRSYQDISGSRVREILTQNRRPPSYLMRPAVSRFLTDLARNNGGLFVKGAAMKIFWFTGLSGSGKTTIATQARDVLEKEGKKVLLIDGDEIRAKYKQALGFSREEIIQNNRFIAGLCRERMGEFDYIFVSVITPFREIRQELRKNFEKQYVEIYVKATLEQVARRDVKGLYKKALEGKINNFIGVDPLVPYEPPGNPDLVIDTQIQPVERSLEQFMDFVHLAQRSK